MLDTYWLLDKDTFSFFLERITKFQPSSMPGFLSQAAPSNTGRVFGHPSYKTFIEGDSYIIPIQGFLMRGYDAFTDWITGGTTLYPDIEKAIQLANAEDKVKNIILAIDSPGGSVVGAFDASDAIKASVKPVVAYVSGVATSAAYLMASQAGKIIAGNDGDFVGSIGVVTRLQVSDKEIVVTSSQAPFKAPDPRTEAGFKAVQKQLDMMHSLFVSRIAAGRGISADKVNSDYGQGMVLTAIEAKKSGMVDQIGINQDMDNQNSSVDENKTNGGAKIMTLAELQQQHPQIYADVLALGAKGENARCMAHVTMMKFDPDFAVACIKDGTGFGPAEQARYQEGMGKALLADKGKAGAVQPVQAGADGAGATGATGGDVMADAFALAQKMHVASASGVPSVFQPKVGV